jgi:hypothetical protein
MAHWSEDARRLDLQEHQATSLADMMAIDSVSEPAVYLFWFPAAPNGRDGSTERGVLRLLCRAMWASSCRLSGGYSNDPRRKQQGYFHFWRRFCISSFGLP